MWVVSRPLKNDKVDAQDITKESCKSFICSDVGVSNLKSQNSTDVSIIISGVKLKHATYGLPLAGRDVRDFRVLFA